MLTFRLYREDTSSYGRPALVHIDPAAVVSVEETERRPAFRGWHQVAVITTSAGDKYTVEDGARTAGQQIALGKAAALQAARQLLAREK